MFGNSTQLQSWTFKDDEEIHNLRKNANKNYTENLNIKVSGPYLLPDEEVILMKEYVRKLRQFCHNYRDPRDNRVKMPLHVTCTATHYFQRFYLYNSVMDYHPNNILHICIYLACKVEEFYVTITDYLYNIEGSDEEEKKLIAVTILNSELQTTQELKFHLIVHQPYRAVEGLLIDIKTRFTAINDGEIMRSSLDEFLENVHLTDAIILYSPSQIALAAVTTAAGRLGIKLDSYVTDTLFTHNKEMLPKLIDAVRKIKKYVKNASVGSSSDVIESLEEKLMLCRNPENDVTTQEYRMKQARLEQQDCEDFHLVSSTIGEVDISGVEEPILTEWDSEYGAMKGIQGVGLNMTSSDGDVMEGFED